MRGYRACVWVVFAACSAPPGVVDGGVGDAHDASSDASDAVDASLDAASASLVLVSTYDHFGSVGVGYPTAPIDVTVTNTGGVATYALDTSITSTPAQFAISADLCGGIALDPGASCTFQVRFMPVTQGNAVATVVVGDGAVSATKQLGGQTIIIDEINITSPNNHDFGSVSIGSTTASSSFTVTNVGGMTHGPIALTLAGANPAAFTLVNDNCTDTQLAANTSCTFGVTFSPSASGIASTNIQISSSPGGINVVGARGTGIDP